jgi:hypothetical protein
LPGIPQFRLDGDEGGGADASLAAAIHAQTAALAKVLASRDNTLI